MIKFEDDNIRDIYFGGSRIKKIYLGNDLIYRYIPERYRTVNGIKNTAKTSVPTGILLDSTNWEIESIFTVNSDTVNNSFYYLQSRASSGTRIHGISGSSTNNTITIDCGSVGGNGTLTSEIRRGPNNKYYYKGGINNTTISLYVKNLTTSAQDNKTGELTTYTNPTTAVCLFGDYNKLVSGYICHYVKIRKNNEIVIEYIPVIDTQDNNKAGFYNTVNNTFVIESQGSLIAVE